MFDAESRELLARAHDEILGLRQRLSVVEPKAHAYDTIAQLSRLATPEEGRGMAEDIAWKIRKALDHDQAERDRQNQTSNEVG